MEAVTTNGVKHESSSDQVTEARERATQAERSSSRSGDDVGDQIRHTSSSADLSRPRPHTYRRNRCDDGMTAVRHVTSDVSGTPPLPPRHITPIRRTPAVTSAPNLAGVCYCALQCGRHRCFQLFTTFGTGTLSIDNCAISFYDDFQVRLILLDTSI